MRTPESSADIDHDRRRLVGAAALSFAAAQIGMPGSANAQETTSGSSTAKAAINASFAPLKRIDAGVLIRT